MKTTGSFFRCLESRYAFCDALQGWRLELGEDFEWVHARYLERDSSGPPLTSFPCARRCGCAHELIRLGPEDIAAVCRCEPCRCETIALQPPDLICWNLSWSRLGRSVAQCLGLDARNVDPGIARTRQIGCWSSDAVPVFLTLQPERRLFQNALLDLVSRLQTRFILLAPTTSHLDASTLEALTRVRAGFFDLESHVRVSEAGEFTPVQAPGELFRAFTPQVQAENDENVFQKAFALVKALGGSPRGGLSSVEVFSEFCVAGRSVAQIARKHGCARGTVLNRLRAVEKATGMKPDALRRISSHVEKLESKISDSRAKRLHRQRFIDDDDADAEAD